MIISHEQNEAFVPSMVESFIRRMSAHLREHFPKQTAGADDEELRTAILHGIDRAETHGFETERDVCKYIDLMVAFGPEFDTDPALSWNKRLDDDSLPPHLRIDAVYDEAVASLESSRTT